MSFDFGHFQTANLEMQKMIESAESLALTPSSILIVGEGGAGKSTLVQFIIEKSLYNKAVKRWLGQPIEWNEGDICVVENIHLLTETQQITLSQEMDYVRQKLAFKKIRWIATSERDLLSLVEEGQFRRDLFYRLSVLQLRIPSLRERKDDILILAQFFLQVYGHISNKSVKEISIEAQHKLQAHSWPGNVTELENVIERALCVSKENQILAQDIQFHIRLEAVSPKMAGQTLSEMEKKLILQTLQMTDQNKTKAAELLGISIRTLRNKLNEYRQEALQV